MIISNEKCKITSLIYFQLVDLTDFIYLVNSFVLIYDVRKKLK